MNHNRHLLSFALGLGLCVIGVPAVQAQGYRSSNRNCCPPAYVPVCPDTAHPGDLPVPEPDTAATPTPEAPSPQDSIQAQIGAAPQPSLALASGGEGARTAMLGRLDINNRFNLFDNMSAIPRSRAWFGYQLAEGQNSGVQFTDPAQAIFDQHLFLSGASLINGQSLNGQELSQIIQAVEGITGDIRNRGNQNGYRFGVEWMVNEDFSIAAQGQYIQPFDTDDPAEDFTSPQFMAKYVLCRCDYTVHSLILGYSPEVEKDGVVISEDSARLYPGMLSYHQLTDDHFLQGGFQFGLPTEGDLYTFDWAIGLGYWLYRHCSLDCRNDCCACDQPCILGIIPQFEILGKHNLSDTTVRGPFGLSSAAPHDDSGFLLTFTDGGSTSVTLDQAIFVFEEPRHVVDVTVGATILMKNEVSLGTGFTFPITGGEARRAEFLAQLTYGF